MKNLFENAYFGKAYKTRDGRKAIYIEYDKALCKHAFVPDKDTRFTYCFDDGTVWEFETCVDIVSEWKEEINEEELDELLMQLLICAQQGYTQCAPDDVVIRNMKEILKAKEEQL